MTLENHIEFKDILAGKEKLSGYDSLFSITSKPKSLIDNTKSGLMRYISALPVKTIERTLGEGATPLVPSKIYKNVFIKNEGSNPSGNFKDRESALTLAYAYENGLKRLSIASSGNAALSAALYSQVYNVELDCYVPTRTPESKTNLIDLFGAQKHVIGTTYEDSYHYLLRHNPKGSVNITPGVFSLRSDGSKTIAYEIFEQLGDKVPDVVVCPAGNGSALASIYHGFAELAEWGYSTKIPAMVSVQLKGADPINQSLKSGRWITVLEDIPESDCEAIVAKESFCSPKAVYAIKKSKGFGISVSDKQVLRGLEYAIKKEGILPEFSSASVFASLLINKERLKSRGKTIVLINSASGLKDIHNLYTALAGRG